MRSRREKSPVLSQFLVLLHLLLGAGAIFGGTAFLIDPSGALINMPLSILQNSPFQNFLIPGIILLLVLGIFPLSVAFGLITERPWKLGSILSLFRNMHWAWNGSLYAGFALIIWIAVQVFMIGEAAVIHLVYLGLGLLIQAVTLLPSVQKRFQLDRTRDVSKVS